MAGKTVLKWVNKFSGETGYVKTVSVAKGYFINTPNVAEAKSYKSETAINKDLAILEGFGEMVNNNFFTEVV